MHPFSIPWKHQKTLRFPNKWRQIYKQTSSTFYTSNDKRAEKKIFLRRHNKDISLKVCWGLHLWEMVV